MSGHSKWATTKHKKAITDSRRAKAFAKLIKNIEVAAKMGGADLSGNPTLVDAVQRLRSRAKTKFVIVGTGDQLSWLQKQLPFAIFTGGSDT